MSWKERTRLDERVILVAEYVKGERTMAERCREFGVSRKTGYKGWRVTAPKAPRVWSIVLGRPTRTRILQACAGDFEPRV